MVVGRRREVSGATGPNGIPKTVGSLGALGFCRLIGRYCDHGSAVSHGSWAEDEASDKAGGSCSVSVVPSVNEAKVEW